MHGDMYSIMLRAPPCWHRILVYCDTVTVSLYNLPVHVGTGPMNSPSVNSGTRTLVPYGKTAAVSMQLSVPNGLGWDASMGMHAAPVHPCAGKRLPCTGNRANGPM